MRQVKRDRGGQVELLNTQVDMVGDAPDSHEHVIEYVMCPHDHALVLPRHLLIAIQRRCNNHLAPVRVEITHRLRERVEDNITCIPFMDGDGQEMEVMNSAFMAYAYTGIAVRGCRVRGHVESDR